MYDRFTDRARRVMQFANQEAQRFNHEYIGTEHILLGLVKAGDGVAAEVLMKMGVKLIKIRLEVEKLVQSGPEMITMGKLPQTPRAKKVLENSMIEARDMQHSFVDTEHLLLGLLRVEEGVASQVLRDLCGTIEHVRQAVVDFLDSPESERVKRAPAEARAVAKSKTPALDSFTRDLTGLARDKKLRPVLCREKEIDRLVAVLGRLDRNSAVLIGPGGVGRQSIANGLAHRIASGSASDSINECRVLELDQAFLIAGTKYRGQFEERVKAIVNEMRRAKNIILISPHIHLLGRLGDFEESGLSALDVLKQSMSNRYIRCIGVCSPQDYEEQPSNGPVDVDNVIAALALETGISEQDIRDRK